MGNNSSKAPTTMTPVKSNLAKNSAATATDHDDLRRILLDPRSPDVNRTPLPENVANRFVDRHQMVNAAMAAEIDVPKTPVTAFRQKLLNVSINEMKLLDPRSPSQFIPRTPISAASLDDTKAASTTHFSLEYTGIIEEASCRNFNERLANLTLDDSDTETNAKPAVKLQKIHEEASADVPTEAPVHILADVNVMDVTQEKIAPMDETSQSDPRSPSVSIPRTPLVLSTVTPTILVAKLERVDADEEKSISPIVGDVAEPKAKPPATFSSTPIVATGGVRKSKLPKRTVLHKTEEENVAESERAAVNEVLAHNKSLEVLITPAKRAMKNHGLDKPRTPLGVLNRRSRSFENLSVQPSKGLAAANANAFRAKLNNENVFATPKPKKSIALDAINVGYKPHKIQVYND